MELSEVVPWGRSYDEYKAMFSLSAEDLNKSILGCADGPASFNARLTAAGGKIISIDPLYQFDREQIERRIREVYPLVMEQVKISQSDFVWSGISSIEQLGQQRMQAMNSFLEDYHKGKQAGRYLNIALPELPFDNKTFDLTLCSHYLFLYSKQVDLSQHILAMKELCRVAKEVRVYPLLSLDGKKSIFIEPVIAALTEMGIKVCLQDVSYQFQKGAKQMLIANNID